MVRFAVVLVAFVVASCSSTAPTVPIDEHFVLAPRETAKVAGTGTTILFAGVENDSRCPADAICIQGGDAIVWLHVLSGGRVVSFDLHTADLRPVAYEGLSIGLVSLTPYPFSSRPIQPSEYRATLRVTD